MPDPRNSQGVIVKYIEEGTNSDILQGDLLGVTLLEIMGPVKRAKGCWECTILKVHSHREQKDSVGNGITLEPVYSASS